MPDEPSKKAIKARIERMVPRASQVFETLITPADLKCTNKDCGVSPVKCEGCGAEVHVTRRDATALRAAEYVMGMAGHGKVDRKKDETNAKGEGDAKGDVLTWVAQQPAGVAREVAEKALETLPEKVRQEICWQHVRKVV